MSAFAILAVVALGISPFAGLPQPGSLTKAAKFWVDVTGAPGRAVHLRAVGVPNGYVASFCTRRVCAPFAVTFALPMSGHDGVELELIANAPGARPPRTVTVTAGPARASIAFSRATY